MLEASASTGRPTHLLAYTQGAYPLDVPYEVHRIPDFPKVRSLRSGPSWGKIALDARCIIETRRLARRVQPTAIVAHHIEAALAALAAQVAPVYYVAHTSLARELPVYFPSLPARPMGRVAKLVEAIVCERAAGVAAVAPSLAQLLGRSARYLPVPWTLQDAPRPTRSEARTALGFSPNAHLCLYAGNLDRYQGWEHLIEALAILRRTDPRARLLMATESDPAPARHLAHRLDVTDSLQFCRIDGERARQLAHAASDLAWVPRRTEGGLPIKMLDAFARELPVVAMDRATAALPVKGACIAVPDDDAHALAAGARRLLEGDRAAAAIAQQGRRYLATHHSAEAYAAAMRELLDEPEANPPATRPALSTYAPTRLLLDPNRRHQVLFFSQLALEKQHGRPLGRIALTRPKTR
jgi:glycosyltransferase involved in cell wall biosynthesis